MSRDYDDDTRSLVWFMAGLGVGAVTALLFAPRTGKETRKILARAADRGRDYLEDRADDLRDTAGKVRSHASDLADRSRDLYERGRDLAKDVGEDAATLLDRGRKIVRG